MEPRTFPSALVLFAHPDDAEFTVVGFKEGAGVEAGCVVWQCRTPQGAEFGGPPTVDDVAKPARDQWKEVVAAAPEALAAVSLIDRKLINLLPNHCGIVNIGRARVMDYGAMVDRLRSGTLAGAVCDVFDPEPLPADSPLWDVPNLIVSPHAGVDDGSVYVDRGLDIFADNLKRYLSGRKLRNVIDYDAGY